jgi:hypothetical protein
MPRSRTVISLSLKSTSIKDHASCAICFVRKYSSNRAGDCITEYEALTAEVRSDGVFLHKSEKPCSAAPTRSWPQRIPQMCLYALEFVCLCTRVLWFARHIFKSRSRVSPAPVLGGVRLIVQARVNVDPPIPSRSRALPPAVFRIVSSTHPSSLGYK